MLSNLASSYTSALIIFPPNQRPSSDLTAASPSKCCDINEKGQCHTTPSCTGVILLPPHVPCSHTSCTLLPHLMYPAPTPHVPCLLPHLMYPACSHTSCTLLPHLMYPAPTPHVPCSHTSCTLLPHLMYPACSHTSCTLLPHLMHPAPTSCTLLPPHVPCSHTSCTLLPNIILTAGMFKCDKYLDHNLSVVL